MSLAGRFFPSTMRMDSELRLAIVGPRLGVPAGGSRTPGSGARRSRRAGESWTGRPRGGPRRTVEDRGGRGCERGGEGIASTSFTPAPAPRAGGTAHRRANRRLGLVRAAALIGRLGRGGAEPQPGIEAQPPWWGEGCPSRRAAMSCAPWPAPRICVGGGRGPSARPRRAGAVGSSVCSEVWACAGTRGTVACGEAGVWEALPRCQVSEQSDEFSKQYA